MRILFSPVGMTDPLSKKNDGSMLHIVRWYKPEFVVLFLSAEVAQHQRDDMRYTKAIELLCDEAGRHLPEIKIIDGYSDIQPHIYDKHIDIFRNEIAALREEHPDAEILLNAASGTPAMKQALITIAAFEPGLTAIQVDNPHPEASGVDNGSEIGRTNPDDFDLEYYWEDNRDNVGGSLNRCRKVESPNFRELITRDNIRSLVEHYDYVAAQLLVKDCPTIDKEARRLIDGCVCRIRHDPGRGLGCFEGSQFPWDTGNSLSEYISVLEIYIERRQWEDYLRALTPAYFNTVRRRAAQFVPEDDWLASETSGEEAFIDVEKVKTNKRLSKALRLKPGDRHAYSTHFLALLKEYDYRSEATRLCRRLRGMEVERNKVAHRITKIDRNLFEKQAGMTFRESIDALLKLNHVQPGLYARINERIVELL